jgi:hypothetical protein
MMMMFTVPFSGVPVVSRNRIAGQLSRTQAASSIATGGFMVCPAALVQAGGEQQQALRRRIYQWALEQAAAVVRPSLLKRFQKDLLN